MILYHGSNPNTKLYIQSAGYIYSLLEEELKNK